VLTGKYAPGQAPQEGSRAARADKRILETEFREESLQIAQTLRQYCERKGVSLAHFATAWVLANRHVSAVIAGPRTLAQWQDYVGALEVQSRRKTRRWSTVWWRRATPRRPGITTRLTP
jgi:aryl-alcohol dehydrogenase-like predicted oxidoreductase